VADAEPKSQTIHLGESASLNGTWSFDADGFITAYDWKFGDGSTGAGVTTAHAYTAEGIFGAALTVTDNAGKKSTDVARVTVLGNPPVANAGGPYTFGESFATLGIYTVTLNGTGSTDDYGIASYVWDFGTPLSDTFAGTVPSGSPAPA
jgi:PKD repeat protein